MGLNPNEAVDVQILVAAALVATVCRIILRNNVKTGRAGFSIVGGCQFQRIKLREH
jgi:hypothetical protein